jgi:tRNA pseudouridine65 synthase
LNLQILYQDEFLIAVNKPAGLLVHRSMLDKYETQFAMQLLRDQIGQHVFPVHRLDRPTSGVLLFALSAAMATQIGALFAAQQVTKRYIAIVRGYTDEEGKIDYALREKLDKIADKKAQKDKPAQEAQTSYQRLAQFELPHAVGRYNSARYSLLELTPHTGRKHQLRRHMAHIRHPIVGDTSHGDGTQNKFIKQQYGFLGLALSCASLSFVHPIKQQQIEIKADFDLRMLNMLSQWGWHCSELILSGAETVNG